MTWNASTNHGNPWKPIVYGLDSWEFLPNLSIPAKPLTPEAPDREVAITPRLQVIMETDDFGRNALTFRIGLKKSRREVGNKHNTPETQSKKTSELGVFQEFSSKNFLGLMDRWLLTLLAGFCMAKLNIELEASEESFNFNRRGVFAWGIKSLNCWSSHSHRTKVGIEILQNFTVMAHRRINSMLLTSIDMIFNDFP